MNAISRAASAMSSVLAANRPRLRGTKTAGTSCGSARLELLRRARRAHRAAPALVSFSDAA